MPRAPGRPDGALRVRKLPSKAAYADPRALHGCLDAERDGGVDGQASLSWDVRDGHADEVLQEALEAGPRGLGSDCEKLLREGSFRVFRRERRRLRGQASGED